MIICKARRSCVCTWKRNLDGEAVWCALDATPEQCKDAEPAAAHLGKLAEKMGVKKEDIK